MYLTFISAWILQIIIIFVGATSYRQENEIIHLNDFALLYNAPSSFCYNVVFSRTESSVGRGNQEECPMTFDSAYIWTRAFGWKSEQRHSRWFIIITVATGESPSCLRTIFVSEAITYCRNFPAFYDRVCLSPPPHCLSLSLIITLPFMRPRDIFLLHSKAGDHQPTRTQQQYRFEQSKAQHRVLWLIHKEILFPSPKEKDRAVEKQQNDWKFRKIN